MLSTKYLIKSAKEVPDTWIFEHYCLLGERLSGQDLKIKSIFNPKEKTPSMCLYTKNGKYWFKDFSTGKGGNAINLVQELYKEEYKYACSRIEQEYNQYVLLNNGTEHKLTEFKIQSRYKVTHAATREWRTQDKTFWQNFGISSKLLDFHNVRPLESYKMEKTENGELKSLEIKGAFIYGYYSNNGSLHKIYQPKVKDHKFIKIVSYLQGIDQLKGYPFLIIASSLKDAMVIKSAGLKVDVIAPDSENTIIKKETIESLQEKYQKVLTLFDNDDAGIAAMLKYKELYGLDYIYFDLEKDVADAVNIHGPSKTFCRLIPAINKKLN